GTSGAVQSDVKRLPLPPWDGLVIRPFFTLPRRDAHPNVKRDGLAIRPTHHSTARSRASRSRTSSGVAAHRVAWPSLRPGRGFLPYRCRCAPGTASTFATSGSVPIRLTIAEHATASVGPIGQPTTARRWFSNWLVRAPSIVQWPL